MVGPVLCELVILGPALYMLLLRPVADENGPVSNDGLNARSSAWKSVRYAALVTPGIVLFVLWPLMHNFLPIVRGGMLLLNKATLRQSLVEILTSTGFAVGATVMSLGIALANLRSLSVFASCVWIARVLDKSVTARPVGFISSQPCSVGHVSVAGTARTLRHLAPAAAGSNLGCASVCSRGWTAVNARF